MVSGGCAMHAIDEPRQKSAQLREDRIDLRLVHARLVLIDQRIVRREVRGRAERRLPSRESTASSSANGASMARQSLAARAMRHDLFATRAVTTALHHQRLR